MWRTKLARCAVAGAIAGLVLAGFPAAPPSPAAAAAKPVVYLTFDDGPGVETARFLDLLARYRIRATFFTTGRAVAANPDLARRIVAEGHAIANHTWSHARLTSLSAASAVNELVWASQAIASTTGVTPRCYRPPYGAVSSRIHSLAVSAGLPNADWTAGSGGTHWGLWDIDTNDWRLSQVGSGWTESAMMTELNRVGDGDTVLLHDGSASRARGLAVLTQWLDRNHDRYDFRTLPGCGGRPVEPPMDQDRPQRWHRFQIARLYRAYFGREPDPAGWEHWNRVYSEGRSLSEISHWFALSSEFNLQGTLTNDELTAFVYRRVLEREPEPAGYRYWRDLLDLGLARGDLVVQFSESDEYVVRTSQVITGACHQATVEDSYRCLAASLPIYDW